MMKLPIAFALCLAAVTTLATSVATAAPSSGLLLGVYAYPNYQGLRVTDTMPGYSAQGRLFGGDVLLRVANGGGVYSAKTPAALEFAKDQIGPYSQAALEVYRPSVGTIYLWVDFQPVDGGVQAYSSSGQPVKKLKANILTEKEKPGAAAMFRSAEQRQNQVQPRPTLRPELEFHNRIFRNRHPSHHSGGGPASLFK
jgi:hypothetical protein